MINHCFKCEEKILDGEEVVFSFEWDAFCHKRCCPAYNKDVEILPECKVCDVYLLRDTSISLNDLENWLEEGS